MFNVIDIRFISIIYRECTYDIILQNYILYLTLSLNSTSNIMVIWYFFEIYVALCVAQSISSFTSVAHAQQIAWQQQQQQKQATIEEKYYYHIHHITWCAFH